MINKYHNKIQNDFNDTLWDDRLYNKNGLPFPDVISNILKIKPQHDNSIYILFYNRKIAGKVISYRTPINSEYALSNDDKVVLALYLNNALSTVKIATAKKHTIRAMYLLVLTDKPIYTLRQADYDKIHTSSTKSQRIYLNRLIKWCIEKGYCEHIRTKVSGYKGVMDTLKRRNDKLPQEASLVALGDIFHRVIPEDESLWDTSPQANHSDALTLSIITLSLGSPNRVMAEIRTLQKQELIEWEDRSRLDKNGQPTIRYSLMWNGSKKYKDYENHILAPMADVIKRSLRYMDKVTAPFRILMQFWIKQDSTIADLFPNVDNELQSKIKSIKLTQSDTPTFVQLGFILGFYDNETFLLNLKGPQKSNQSVHVSKLTSDFKFYVSRNSGGALLGFSHFTDKSEIFASERLSLNSFITIGELQEYLFKTIRLSWGSYPLLATNGGVEDNGNGIHICQAMWCLTGSSVGGNGGHYTPFLPSAMNSSFKIDLQGRLFEKYGFSKRLHMSANQFRHYLNHNGDINGLPHHVLNAWSGRADSKHLQNYLHETEEDKIARIPIIDSNDGVIDIRIKSQKEYEELRSQRDITSITSVGFCTKDLRYQPCTYLSEFETQCTFCEQSCHVAHDENGIRILKEDYAVQCKRLDDHLTVPKNNNGIAKQWFKTHKANTYLLGQLIDVLEDPTIPKGAVVRVITDTQEIRIADLKTKSITTRKFQLDVMNKDIQEGLKALDYQEEKSDLDKETDNFMDNLWGNL